METMNLTHYQKTILDAIDLTDYGIEAESNEAKLKAVYSIFESEYLTLFNLQKYRTEINTFANWLQGLPSCLSVPFDNHTIIKEAEKSGFEFMTDKAEENYLMMYWHNLARAFFELK